VHSAHDARRARFNFGEGAKDRGQIAADKGCEPAGVDGAVAAFGPGEVAAEVAEAQVIGGGEASQVGVGGLAVAGTGPGGQGRGWPAVMFPVRDSCPGFLSGGA
jgi:hypothetical protein